MVLRSLCQEVIDFGWTAKIIIRRVSCESLCCQSGVSEINSAMNGLGTYKNEDDDKDHDGMNIISQKCCLFHISEMIKVFGDPNFYLLTFMPPAIV